MKLTKSKLKQIIVEELRLEAEEEAPPESEEKLKSDVERIKKYIDPLLPKINDAVKYAQLLKIILSHQVKGKGKAHRKLKDLFLSGMKEQ